ncbi:AAA family ATPase [Promicromonospora sp. NPDC057138]|uniref:helix-turn-helix transcriptional regulator n=1 Tax=Promicromonospora sp. NPDC057138 TaxID=3346031 RepID=UPI00362C98A2
MAAWTQGSAPGGADSEGGAPGEPLVGRRRESQVLDDLVAGVREGRSQALVLRGDTGVGKTALLGRLVGQAHRCRVARVVGVESEMELAFAGLHQLCAPMLDGLDRVPEPQRDALGTALGLRGGDTPDRFLVGLAVLSLLAEAAVERPLICLVDDVQWLDNASVQTLNFVARRLPQPLPVAIVFAERDQTGQGQTGEDQTVRGLPELVVGGLSDRDAHLLLDAELTGPVDARVRDRMVAETQGNPLALTQLVRGLTPEQMAGGYGLPGTGPLAGRMEGAFERRLAPLPPETRTLLLVAAAEPGRDPALVWRAATALRVGVAAAEPATAAGLLDVGDQVRFAHPLARSAVYRAADPDARRAAHRALAEAADPAADPERRAWHRAHAVAGPDEDVAAELERCAARAQARGGVAAAAAFRERSAELTPDPALRAERALRAAQAKFHTGAPERALGLLTAVDAGPADDLLRARADLVRAQIAGARGDGRDGPLLPVARRLEPLDPELARDTYRDALQAALVCGRLARSGGVREVATALLAFPRSDVGRPVCDDLLEGMSTVVTAGYAAGAPTLRRAVRDVEAGMDWAIEACLPWMPLVCRMAQDVWDDELWHALTTRSVEAARTHGQLRVLPPLLFSSTALQALEGDLDGAQAAGEEAAMIAEATGNLSLLPYGNVFVAALRGDEERTTALLAGAAAEAAARAEGHWLPAAAWSAAVLHNGLGQYDRALSASEEGSAYPDELGLGSWSLVELVEAASRVGEPDRAKDALARLDEIAQACRTDWALGAAARSRALLGEGADAEEAYREAIERLARTRLTALHARTCLVYGEWLRRESRRTDAREQLRLAHDLLAASGIEGFAQRARRELLACGETVRVRSGDPAAVLTEQEAQIARLAVDGGTNAEIAGRLFISPRTVEWHLRKVYTKLGIARRTELRQALNTAAVGPRTSR